MKYKLLFVILLSLHAMNTMAQVTQLYQVVLIKTVKHETGLTERKFVVIDSAGVIKSEANKQGEKLAAENFTQAVNKLLNTQNFTKMPANNTLNREVKNPYLPGEYLNIYIIKMPDFIADGSFTNKTYYYNSTFYEYAGAVKTPAYAILKFLNVENAALLNDYLE